MRLIRSKGVGVYFVTQNPIDIPDTVLGQLGNKVQHALRAFTPREQKAVKAMAETFRPNPDVDVETAVTDLGVGEALLSLLEADGSPSMVQRAFIVPPHGHIGAIAPEQRQQVMAASLVAGHYEQVIDRESAEEVLAARAQAVVAAADQARSRGGSGQAGRSRPPSRRRGPRRRPSSGRRKAPARPQRQHGRDARQERDPRRGQPGRPLDRPRPARHDPQGEVSGGRRRLRPALRRLSWGTQDVACVTVFALSVTRS